MAEKKTQAASWPIEEHMGFQRATWIVSRIGWGVMAIIVILALMGILGGTTSQTHRTAPDGSVHLIYEKTMRSHTPTQVVIHVPAAGGADTVTVHIGHAFIDAMDIQSIIPSPTQSMLHADGVVLTFLAAAEGSANITLAAFPNTWGRLESDIGLEGRPSARLSAFILP